MKLNLARTLHRSAANGPGERFVVWVQGCPLACPGCWNPDTWSFERRVVRDIDELAAEILSVEDIEGVTFTGGEPFAQARALAELARRVRHRGLSAFVFGRCTKQRETIKSRIADAMNFLGLLYAMLAARGMEEPFPFVPRTAWAFSRATRRQL